MVSTYTSVDTVDQMFPVGCVLACFCCAVVEKCTMKPNSKICKVEYSQSAYPKNYYYPKSNSNSSTVVCTNLPAITNSPKPFLFGQSWNGRYILRTSMLIANVAEALCPYFWIIKSVSAHSAPKYILRSIVISKRPTDRPTDGSTKIGTAQ